MRLDRKLMTFAVIMLAAAFVTGSAFAMGSPSADSKKGKEDKESCESCDKESESHEGGKGFGGYAKRADVIKKYDTDGDGELSEEEKENESLKNAWRAETGKKEHDDESCEHSH